MGFIISCYIFCAHHCCLARLPLKRVLTLNLELPESWLVEPVMALHDLDNLRLADIPEQVAYAEYELEAIMLTGSCNEVDSSWGKKSKLPPPRGLQLHLGTNSNPHQASHKAATRQQG
eukprot:GHRR01034073.1.p1 GENE.GHRR01034073.1~~GHRR01034073.1.p1  ORF type:complete len:118 (+),score=33.34 GHRR01034073.1:436-789(+)